MSNRSRSARGEVFRSGPNESVLALSKQSTHLKAYRSLSVIRVLLAVTTMLLVALPSSAQAGTYTVRSCWASDDIDGWSRASSVPPSSPLGFDLGLPPGSTTENHCWE